jgi:hypothetical protein
MQPMTRPVRNIAVVEFKTGPVSLAALDSPYDSTGPNPTANSE